MVGDDAQSIYAFRAATVRNILDFPDSFAPRADVITLDRNYRSTQPILAAANAVIGLARERFTKTLWTERASERKPSLVTVQSEADQARYMVDRILEDRETGMKLKDQAVLFRTSSHSVQLEAELTRRNVPYVKFGGLKFLDSAHVKDLLSFLRMARNPRGYVHAMRTRFIPRDILEHFETVHWSPTQHGGAPRPAPAPVDRGIVAADVELSPYRGIVAVSDL